jgi:pimeloyl-ACP methyl ester carboxylesterase
LGSNHIALVALGPLIYEKIFASPSFDPSLTPGLVDYEAVRDSYPRTEFAFPSHQEKLTGYFYDRKDSEKIVVVSAGIADPADGYLAQEMYFYDHGYDVIAYDGYGKGKSGGSWMRGLPEAEEDLASLLTYLKTSEWKEEPLYLFGHSQGAYASAAVLTEGFSGIKAVAAVSAFDSPEQTILNFARRKVSFLADLSNPYILSFEHILYGKKSDLSAFDGVKNSSLPLLIAHGEEDKTIPIRENSLYQRKEEIQDPKATYYLGTGDEGGHASILYSSAAVAYQKSVEEDRKTLADRYSGSIPTDPLKSFIASVDDRRYSEVNSELMETILSVFAKA